MPCVLNRIILFGLFATSTAPGLAAVTLKCGTLIDGIASVPQKNVLIVLTGNKITELRNYDPTAAPSNDPEIIDLSRETCLPGLIDVHVHYIEPAPGAKKLDTKPLQPATADNFRRALRFGFQVSATWALRPFGPLMSRSAKPSMTRSLSAQGCRCL